MIIHKRLFVISSSYPSIENPASFAFIHSRTLQLSEFFDETVVLTREKVSIFRFICSFFISNYSIPKTNSYLYHGIQVRVIKYLSFFPENLIPLNGFLNFFSVKKQIKDLVVNDTCIHLATSGDFMLVASFILRKMNLKYFASAIGNYENTYINRETNINHKVIKYVFLKACFVYAVSKPLKLKIENVFPILDIIEYISGVNLSLFKIERKFMLNRVNYGIEMDAFVIMYSGRITESKGINELLSAYKRINDRKMYLVLVGQLKMSINTKDYKNLIILSPVNQVELNILLNLTDIFVLPSYSEGTPNCLVEAMAVGLATISTKVGGIVDLITNNENGLLIKSKSIDELYSAITKLRSDPMLARKLGENAYKLVVERYNSNNNKIILYDKIVKKECFNYNC